MNYSMREENNDNKTSLRKTFFLGLTPLIIAVLFYISLSVCIQVLRCYSNWRLKKQLVIVRCPEQCLIISNLLTDDITQQSISQVI